MFLSPQVVVISAVEHHAILDPAHWLQTHEGAEVITIPVTKDGVINLQVLQELVSARGPEIAVISIMHSNNETGVLQPIKEVVQIAGDIPVHTDAVQSFKKIPVSSPFYGEAIIHAAYFIIKSHFLKMLNI